MKANRIPIPGAGFKKYERLKSKKLLSLLFSEGIVVCNYPVKVLFIPLSEDRSDFPAKVLLSVSKRLHPKAHVRNKYKRLMREAYRQEKTILIDALLKQNKRIALGFIYRSKQAVNILDLRLHIQGALLKVIETLKEKNEE
ncbi:MAG: ribonuclease P protein component [Chitinophagales bacterium]